MDVNRLAVEVGARMRFPANGSPRVVRPIKGLALLGQDAPSSFEATLYEPVVCLILRGSKEVSIGERSLTVRQGECLLVSHDLPVRSRIVRAPYLALVLDIDVATVRGLYDEVAGTAPSGRADAAQVHRADPDLLDALGRYFALTNSPSDARVLAPLVAKEIHYRLLVAPIGGMLRQLIRYDSTASAIGRAIGHIRGDISAPLAVPELARRVGMSSSSFHKHFKTVTATTPVQYQKDLRLLEARRLLTTGGSTVIGAAVQVGYESPSQFSREYSRKFGVPPSRDLADSASLGSPGPRLVERPSPLRAQEGSSST